MKTSAMLGGQRGLGLRSIAWVLLLAFTLQSFLTQTHIHGAPGIGGFAVVKILSRTPSPVKAPDTGTDCPICQAITHAGAFFTPAAPSVLLSVSWVESIAPVIIVDTIETISTHPWQSRAPPRH
jgi:hypothetical protein